MNGITVVCRAAPPVRPLAATAPRLSTELRTSASVAPPTQSTAAAQRAFASGRGFASGSAGSRPITSAAPSSFSSSGGQSLAGRDLTPSVLFVCPGPRDVRRGVHRGIPRNPTGRTRHSRRHAGAVRPCRRIRRPRVSGKRVAGATKSRRTERGVHRRLTPRRLRASSPSRSCRLAVVDENWAACGRWVAYPSDQNSDQWVTRGRR